ncbi:MAG: DUF2029 domain-containing protein [Propionibacteriaceae bacterium]|nr:DUF2029 domain-containing protein [Propionibacteriaceae bacterium]
MPASTVSDAAPVAASSSWYRKATTALFDGARLDSPRFLLMFWFVARLVVLGIWALLGLGAQNDVLYYFDHIDALAQVGPAQTMPEYPTPALWVLWVPWLLGFGTSVGYTMAFACLMLLLDAAFTYTLWRTGGHRRGQAVIFWTLFLGFIGPTAYLRFDLIVSVLAGWSLILIRRDHAGTGGALIGLGAAVKLWPAVLWPALCGGHKKTVLRATLGFALVGVVSAGASLLWGGWDRLISPLTYQTDRGLQVESVFASVPMFIRSLGLGDYAVTVSRYLAFEIWGTGVQFWLSLASVSVFVGYGLIAVTYVLWFIRGHGRLREAAVLMLFAITVLIVTNKTFSPQYVIWLGSPLAATFVIMGGRQPHLPSHDGDRLRLRRITSLVLTLTLATLLVYPIGYVPLVNDVTNWMHFLRVPVTVVLVARNCMVIWLMVELALWVASFLKPKAWAQVRRPVTNGVSQ